MSGSEDRGMPARLVRQSASWGLPARLGILALVVLVAYPLVAWIVQSQREVSVWGAAALAASICWLGAALAMIFTALMRGPQGAMLAMLFGMAFRLGLPFAVGLMLSRRFVELEAAGFFGLVLGFYLVTLVAETLLVLPLVKTNSPVAKA